LKQTMHIVQAFTEDARGRLKPDKPEQQKTAQMARARAERLLPSRIGVVAFSQSGDSEMGDFDDPVILYKAGKLPSSFDN
jgi:hypothetical protein